ncbi:MAG: hypothetical protein MPJ50_05385 [Pirellulales bacterium]|nr:hypothetical protein [Pirellulales bacterium]
MARKVLNRKELRQESEAAEKKKTTKKKAAKKTAKRKSRAKKATEDVRMKAFWGVFSQSLKRVALYEYHDRKAAEKKAKELSTNTPHFVRPVKEPIEETE